VTVGILNFNNPNEYVIDGAGALTLQTSSGSAGIVVQQGTQKINLPLTIASNTSINVASGSTLLISDPVTINPGVAVTSTGTVAYQSTIALGTGASLALSSSTSASALSLAANATVSVGTSTGSRSLIQVDSLSTASGSTINLANNDLIVHGGNLAAVTALLKSGYNEAGGGNWSGPGIQSSAAASNTTHLTALGAIQASSAGTYDGAAVAAGDVIVRYTYYGDANLDGKVDGSDYSLIDAGYASHGKLSGWSNGDFNYDGVIDGSDYADRQRVQRPECPDRGGVGGAGRDVNGAGRDVDPARRGRARTGVAGSDRHWRGGLGRPPTASCLQGVWATARLNSALRRDVPTDGPPFLPDLFFTRFP
jgi:hypothetical protein